MNADMLVGEPLVARTLAACLAGLLALLLAPAVAAERLPLRLYTVADGLPGDGIQALALDPRGFLWIGTTTGLGRFDGSAVVSYDRRDGLPHASVAGVHVAPDGAVWVGTARGLARLRPGRRGDGGRGVFEPVLLDEHDPPQVQALVGDGSAGGGVLWVGTRRGLFAVDAGRDGEVRARAVTLPVPERLRGVRALAAAGGTLWIGTEGGLLRRSSGAEMRAVPVEGGAGGEGAVRALAPAGPDGVWAAVGGELVRLPGTGRADPVREPLGGVLAGAVVNALSPDGAGGLWVASSRGLGHLVHGRWTGYGTVHGLAEPNLSALAREPSGTLWVGTESRGLMRLAERGFVSFGPADGLGNPRVAALVEDRDGDLVVLSGGEARPKLYRYVAGRFEDVTPRAVLKAERPGWGWNQVVVRDRRGEWWIGTGEGLYRFPAVPAADLVGAAPVRRYGRADGLAGEDVFRVFEDARGDLWVSLLDTEASLVRFRRESGAAVRFEPLPLFPTPLASAPTVFADTPGGDVWAGFYVGGLARYRQGEPPRFFPPGEAGLPPGFVHGLHLDGRGRLWVATSGGAAWIDAPAAAVPGSASFTPVVGLGSDSVRAVGEDAQGRIYLGTARGIDRLGPRTGGVESFTTADGLANLTTTTLLRDRRGDLWVGTLQGLSRMSPTSVLAGPPPGVLVSDVSVDGVPRLASPLPVRAVAGIELAPDERRLRIAFRPASLAPEPGLAFQYRLDGDAAGWTRPDPSREVLFDRLRPGRYRFEVRAVDGEGVAGPEAGEVVFHVQAPLWRRGWFLALSAALLAGAAWGGHRYRVRRLLALERLRTRIASDLHDDLGASLSRISLLSEVARLRIEAREADRAGELLEDVGETARELSGVLSDVVWAVDPRQDDLASLVARLRRFASDLLEARGARFELLVPAALPSLEPERRRELFLLLKEAVHNAARHARASRVEVELAVGGGTLVAEVRDDGVGFDAAAAAERGGRGLRNLRMRSDLLGARLTVDSGPGRGTRIRLEAPLRRGRGTHEHAVPPSPSP